jgi:hypothetical protein
MLLLHQCCLTGFNNTSLPCYCACKLCCSLGTELAHNLNKYIHQKLLTAMLLYDFPSVFTGSAGDTITIVLCFSSICHCGYFLNPLPCSNLHTCSYKTTHTIMQCGYGWGGWGERSFGSGETANQWMVAQCVATLGVWSFSACTILVTTLKNYVYLSSRSPELHQL